MDSPIIIRKIVDECIGITYLIKQAKTIRVLSPLEVTAIQTSSIQNITDETFRTWVVESDTINKIGIII